MAYRTRINYTAQQKSEMWDRWQRGESLKAIGRAFEVAAENRPGFFISIYLVCRNYDARQRQMPPKGHLNG